MDKYILSCCSTSDLNLEHYKKRNIRFLCFHYFLDGVEHKDDFGETFSMADFYKKMEEGAMTKTSQLNAQDYYNYFENILNEGYNIVHLTLSSGISGTINSARIAVNMLKEKYPDKKIYVIDSLAASSGYGLLMEKLADYKDQGKTMEEVVKYAEELIRMGANIEENGNMLEINGVGTLYGKDVMSKDLRGGAALVIAGLMSEGTTRVENIEYILRGYENLDEKLNKLGANIKKEKVV